MGCGIAGFGRWRQCGATWGLGRQKGGICRLNRQVGGVNADGTVMRMIGRLIFWRGRHRRVLIGVLARSARVGGVLAGRVCMAWQQPAKPHARPRGNNKLK